MKKCSKYKVVIAWNETFWHHDNTPNAWCIMTLLDFSHHQWLWHGLLYPVSQKINLNHSFLCSSPTCLQSLKCFFFSFVFLIYLLCSSEVFSGSNSFLYHLNFHFIAITYRVPVSIYTSSPKQADLAPVTQRVEKSEWGYKMADYHRNSQINHFMSTTY